MELKFGERAADRLANIMGSWAFVIGHIFFLIAWFTLNIVGWFWHWDPYPYILANLFMSAEAALAGPIILMSQNRSAARDRATLEGDFSLDRDALILTKRIAEHLGVVDV